MSSELPLPDSGPRQVGQPQTLADPDEVRVKVMTALNIGKRESITRPIMLWEMTFAEWVVSRGVPPRIDEQCIQATELAGEVISKRYLRNLYRSKSFTEYLGLVQTEHFIAARTKLHAQALEYVDLHYRNAVAADKAGDYKAIPSFTVPMLDRIWPRKETETAAQQVNIILTTKQAGAMALDEIIEVESEVIAPPAEVVDSE